VPSRRDLPDKHSRGYAVIIPKQHQKRGDRRARQNKNSGNSLNRPPSISSNIQMSHRYRFTSTSATPTNITVIGLLGAAGTMCTVANSLTSTLFESVRVKRVAMWSPPAAQGSSVTCSIEWFGGVNSNNKEVSDTSVSVATPAHVTSSPPQQSIASFWNKPQVLNLFLLTAPVGTIIDVDLDLIFSDDETTPQTYAVAAATLGTVYYLALDNVATHIYVPVSLTTTF